MENLAQNPVLAVIEDDEELRELVLAFFRPKGFEVCGFASAEPFLHAVTKEGLEPDVILTDLKLPKIDGIELLARLNHAGCEAPVIVLTASDTPEVAIRAVEAGAYDFVVKPLFFPQLQVSVDRARHFRGIREENRKLRKEISARVSTDGIIGKSGGLRRAVDLARRVADSAATVFISGETGTGKEVIARAVHDLGRRAPHPFIALNCSAIPESLLESELFGHAKGAFTGALEKKIGLFEEAGEGTLFLDEIGDLSPQLQTKLLRVLQERKIKRIGENQYRPVRARIISATHKDLRAEIRARRFREDLYFRLRVIPIHLPALRERREDILPLAEHFLRKFASANGRGRLTFAKSATELLLQAPWRGNVRELENAIERAVVLGTAEQVTADDFVFPEGAPEPVAPVVPLRVAEPAPELPSPSEPGAHPHLFTVDTELGLITLEELTQRYVAFAVARNDGARDRTARELGIDRKTLYRKITDLAAVGGAGSQGPRCGAP